MLQLIIALVGMAILAMGSVFALPSTHPSLIAKPGKDEVGGWTCECGAYNHGNTCQMCGA